MGPKWPYLTYYNVGQTNPHVKGNVDQVEQFGKKFTHMTSNQQWSYNMDTLHSECDVPIKSD